jgi:hypothetical protein
MVTAPMVVFMDDSNIIQPQDIEFVGSATIEDLERNEMIEKDPDEDDPCEHS